MERTPEDNQKGIESTNMSALMVFNRSTHFSYIYQKTEKLVTAVYMITNFIKDSEPLKWKIRENALELMSLNIAWNTVSLSERRDLLKEYQALSLEIVSLSSIAFHSGLISEMNFTILSREFNSLVLVIERGETEKSNERTVVLDPAFFDTTSTVETKATDEASKNVLYNPARPKPVIQKTKGQKEKTIIPAIDIPTQDRKKEYFPLKDVQETALKSGGSKDSKDGRQSIIIKLLSKKSGLGVKDFTDSITGVSEKTIQRELLSMVATGIIKKEGERRWSRYSLI